MDSWDAVRTLPQSRCSRDSPLSEGAKRVRPVPRSGRPASLLEGSEANWINACRGQAHLLWSEGVSLDRSDAVRILPQRG